MSGRHIGEYNRNKKGEEYVISRFDDSDHVYVMFNDNTESGPVKYDSIKRGILKKPKAGNNIAGNQWLKGSIVTLDDDIEAVCDLYRNDNDIRVRLSNGMIVDHLTKAQLESGNIPVTTNNAVYLEERSFSNKKNRVREERDRTFYNTLFLLRRYHVCVIVRPCGFGKTYLFKRLAKLPEYRNVLYIYPHKDAEGLLSVEDAVKYDQKHKKRMGKITTMTYAKLAKMSEEALAKMDYDMVFFDEMQYAGAGKRLADKEVKTGAAPKDHTFPAVKRLMELHPDTHFCGATATPERTDGVRTIQRLFYGITTYPYTEEDAFEDGLYTAPKYVYCTYGIKRMIKNIQSQMKKENMTVSRDEIEKIAGVNKLQQVDAENMNKVIRKVCDETLADTSYMRFICFYPTIKELRENKEKVETWFRKAYPEHSIYSLEIDSRSEKDIKAVRALTKEPGRIDLILNCEMLNTGYHDEFLTGLVLDRRTASWSKYMQMVGRIFSMDADKQAIIFDIGDNIHSDFVFQIDPEDIKQVELKDSAPLKATATAIDNEPSLFPNTFDGIRAAYPRATNWWRVRLEDKAARKRLKTEDGGENTSVLPTQPNPVQTISDWVDGVTEKDVQTAFGEKSVKRLTHTTNRRTDIKRPQKVTITPDPEPDWDELIRTLGYDPRNAMRPAKDGSWLRNRVDIIDNDIDEEEIKERLIRKNIEPACIIAVEQYDKLAPGRRFANYEEAAQPSRKNDVKILKACAWVQNLQWELVLRYMVEKSTVA